MVKRLGDNPLGKKGKERTSGMNLVRDQLMRTRTELEPEAITEEGYLTIHGRIDSATMRDGVLRVHGEELGVKWGGPQPETLPRPREPEPHPKTLPENRTSFVDMLSNSLKIIGMLDDEAWHDYEEILEKLDMSLDDAITILKVLSENQYLVLSERWGKVKKRVSKVEAFDTFSPRALAQQLIAMLKHEKFMIVNLLSKLTVYQAHTILSAPEELIP